ncbi:hypothetical protein FGM00_11355 [Aggregatimonas sangjinii]|uniref:histidine kinase n=1 Tax=Aggregatimonas sangjinii TaxID=2583587 RepID=A0A5B7SVJ0_9FLAO|nr:ATP-binding protein [Aggregatimonas sangjinii]QCX00674.1 hypothetical protein FGM00_11355 [Aggregatimonas sangjinii]
MNKFIFLSFVLLSQLIYPQFEKSSEPVQHIDTLQENDTVSVKFIISRAKNKIGKISRDSVALYYTSAVRMAAKLENQDLFFIETLLEATKFYESNKKYPIAIKTDLLKGLETSKAIAAPKAQAALLLRLAAVEAHEKNYEEALDYLSEVTSLSKKNNYQAILADSYQLYSEIYTITNNLIESSNYNLKALKLYEEQGDNKGLIKANSQLARIYTVSRQYEKGITILRKCIKDNEKNGREAESSLSQVYANLGLLYWQVQKFDSVRFYNKKALRLAKKQHLGSNTIATIHRNLGVASAELGDYESSIESYKLALAYDLRGNLGNTDAIYMLMANTYEKIKDYDNMMYYAKESQKRGDTKPLAYQLEYHRLIGEALQGKGEYKLAFENLKKSNVLNDSLNKTISTAKVMELTQQYEVERKEKENELLTKENAIQELLISESRASRNSLGYLLVALLIIASLVAISLYNIKKANNKLSEQNKVITEQQSSIADALKVEQELNLKLNEANSSLERFFSIIAHDLRAPYNVMLGYADILVEDFEKLNRTSIKTYLSSLHRAAHKNYQLTQNLLSWAITQKGGVRVKKEKLGVYDLIDDTVQLFQELASNKGIDLVNLCPPELVGELDKDIAGSVLSNLVNNAIKFTPRNGLVTIGAKKVGAHVLFKVDDSGVGISESRKKSLFEITSIDSRPGTQNETGSGFGLILCKELINSHDGEIRVKSKTGKGTTVLALF